MSILITNGTSAPLTLSGLFSTNLVTPVALCCFIRVGSFASSGFRTINVIEAGNGSDNYFRLSIRQDSSSKQVAAAISAGTGINRVYNLDAEFTNRWVPCVAVFDVDRNASAYTTLADNSVVSTSAFTGRTPTGVLDLELFGSVYDQSDYRVSNLSVYKSDLSALQVEEFITTGEIADLTPYEKWDADTDWGGGAISSSGSNATAITPPNGWTYSSDNPEFSGAVDYTARKGSTATITHTLTAAGITSATLNGQAVTIASQSGQTASISFTDTITTSGVYDLVLGDGVGNQTLKVQYDVIGLTTNTIQKEGASIGAQSDLEMDVLDATGATVLGNLTGLTTDASGITGQTVVPAGAVGDSVRVSGYSETAGIGFAYKTVLGLL